MRDEAWGSRWPIHVFEERHEASHIPRQVAQRRERNPEINAGPISSLTAGLFSDQDIAGQHPFATPAIVHLSLRGSNGIRAPYRVARRPPKHLVRRLVPVADGPVQVDHDGG